MADIVLKDVRLSFGEKRVLDGFSAVFGEGSVTCVMGESGCGKTTLLNIIMGLLRPDSGEVSGVPGDISVVFQEDRLCEDFSAVTNVMIAAGRAAKEDTVREHLKKLGLGGSLDKPARELSGGMKRRVAIVRCVMADSGLMLLDEPFKGLDEDNRLRAAEYISANRNGRTVIMVTHDRDEAPMLGAELLNMQRV